MNLGIMINRSDSKFLYKFHKLPQFIDCAPNKSVIVNDMRVNRPTPYYEIVEAGEFKDELSNYQLTFSQCVESYPLNYEQYAVMQHACTHFLNLNDILRTEHFINTFFPD